MVKIESSGNPLATTGSYHGLLQMSPGEFSRWGGQGSIYNASANLDAGIRKLQAETGAFRDKYGRDPTPTEIYLQHQQGVGGLASHIANPDQPAWKSMYLTAEGQQKGPDWARRAILGNIPSDLPSQYPGVEDPTSRPFMDLCRRKVEGRGAQPGAPVAPAGCSAEGSPALIGKPPPDTGPYSPQMRQVLGVRYEPPPTPQTAPAATGMTPGAAPAAPAAPETPTAQGDPIGDLLRRLRGRPQADLSPPPFLQMPAFPEPYIPGQQPMRIALVQRQPLKGFYR